LGSEVSNPGFDTWILSPGNEYGCEVSVVKLYTTPRVSSLTPEPSIITGLYTESPTLWLYVISPLFLITNCVIFFSSNLIVSSPIKISPVLPQPIVENTLTRLPTPAVCDKDFSNVVLVEIANSPVTVSGANTMFQIFSPSAVPSGYTLSTVAETKSYSSVSGWIICFPIRSLGSPETIFTFSAYTLIQSDLDALYVKSFGL